MPSKCFIKLARFVLVWCLSEKGNDERLHHCLFLDGERAGPRDADGKEFIQRIVQARDLLKPVVPLVHLVNYGMEMAGILTAGVAVWLNMPQPPLVAFGTSGMKAALNGVPGLSILDGWWIEDWIEGQTGWAIGENCEPRPGDTDRSGCDAAWLSERVLLPLYHRNRDAFVDVMRHCISINGSFFNTQRMVQQHVVRAYLA
jgi:starch phosphorylase